MNPKWRFRHIEDRRLNGDVELTTNYYSEEPIWIVAEGSGYDGDYDKTISMTPGRARELAAWLIKTADTIETCEKMGARSETSADCSNSEQPSVNETAPNETKIDGTPPNG